jgi:DNA (cytosine-5)-methyltransferase 1
MARDYKGFGNQEFNAVVEVKEATKKGYAEAHPGDSINLEQPNSKTRRGRVGAGVAQTLTTSCNQAVVLNKDETDNGTVRIRRLTPTECYRLQGFTAEDCKKASEAGISNSQLYKQAGNSICVPVLEAVYKSLGEIYAEFAQAVKTK